PEHGGLDGARRDGQRSRCNRPGAARGGGDQPARRRGGSDDPDVSHAPRVGRRVVHARGVALPPRVPAHRRESGGTVNGELPSTIADAAAALRDGTITSVALTEGLFARADAHDATLGTY